MTQMLSILLHVIYFLIVLIMGMLTTHRVVNFVIRKFGEDVAFYVSMFCVIGTLYVAYLVI